jgi:hypothetical protein
MGQWLFRPIWQTDKSQADAFAYLPEIPERRRQVEERDA